MHKISSYQDCYKVLDLQPECSWIELRSAYKKSIQKWHPDRFEDGTEEKLAAEHKIKALNIAYNHIHKYYREKGELPPVVNNIKTKPKVTPPSKASAPKTTQNKSRQNDNVTPNTSVKNNISDKQLKSSDNKISKSFVATFSLTILISSYYFFTTNSDHEKHYNPDMKVTKASTNPNKDIELHPEESSSSSTRYLEDNLSPKSDYKTWPLGEKIVDKDDLIDDHYFTNGSSISDVIDIQGAPSKTDGDTWFYGKSEVYFEEGKVSHWVRHADDPLKVRRKLDNLE